MKYLENKDYKLKYFQVWEECKKEFFKLEVHPEYDEFGIDDWSRVNSSETNQLINRVQGELYDWKLRYGKKIFTDGVDFFRIRYLPFPLTKYLLIELSSYMTSQAIGAKIEIIEDSDIPNIDSALKNYFCDFVMFDEKHVFRLDNPGGTTKCGAYYIDSVEEIAPYIAIRNQLKGMSQPLNQYLKLLNIQFINALPYDGNS